ncbi:alpha-L-glutamate ligase [Arthrobacter sp. zg-Y820]|uniref:ATP-grasp domain-containing protein n=1 Tax=unclassified Arthrobacter TaxID=235627 RepID=UPI001E388F42|nr:MULTISPECIES: alpha-L-glutamate ligase [unclassified Arthrobacter]MCC9197099.1 alpha-L-glutamate ligase [Arthrobacter sp. zg-Y820]MDK1279964.1 alpha-L-glutamate ligase [Arthrobacter sp. zg.Y820]MDK1361651.1 alpha-L-glutamate ligase [Arthrobacter sp. zg-Y1219]WIB09263.1 alpha-L-glutamate ligase [Arthrobacter sp. zg-Y820]
MSSARPKIYALHENPEWFPPFARAFEAEGLEVEEWLLTDGVLDLDSVPPEGIFWSRISASSATRGHTLSKDYARSVLSWLEAHGRRTVNGRRILELEMSKVDQLTALRAAGIDTPRTVAAVGRHQILAAAKEFSAPFITKHNQGGKGLGVRKFESHGELADYVAGPEFEEPADGITLIQEFIVAAEPTITRVEIVGGEFIYAITADTARGGFQLCPADACAIDPSTGKPIMPPGATIAPDADTQLFSLREGFDHPIVGRYLDFARRTGLEVCGIEFMETADGRILTYDVNTNTNYNAVVEATAPRSAPRALAQYLAGLGAVPSDK